jgi:hypothetical protein
MSPSTESKPRHHSIAGWAPNVAFSTADAEELEFWTNREISLIENLLKDRGEMDRSAIGEALGCRYWGRCASARRSRRASTAAPSARWGATATRPCSRRVRLSRGAGRSGSGRRRREHGVQEAREARVEVGPAQRDDALRAGRLRERQAGLAQHAQVMGEG